MYQSRKTRKLIAKGQIDDGKTCRHCGRRAKGTSGVCREPRCITREFFAQDGA
jgi:hypothetical protein